MKLTTKLLISTILIILVNINSETASRQSFTSAEKSKLALKSKGFVQNMPIGSLGLPKRREYRTVNQVFGTNPPRRRNTGDVDITRRDCRKLCMDRMPFKVKCTNVIAKHAPNGVLDCFCSKANIGKSTSYTQDDYCYSKKGCKVKVHGQSCLSK